MFRNLKASEVLAAVVAIFLALTLILVSGAALGASMAKAAPIATRTCPVKAEDEPGWDWTRCGNHTRGVVTMHGTPIVVGPCRFSRLVRARALDYLPSDYMRGDVWAMWNGCR